MVNNNNNDNMVVFLNLTCGNSHHEDAHHHQDHKEPNSTHDLAEIMIYAYVDDSPSVADLLWSKQQLNQALYDMQDSILRAVGTVGAVKLAVLAAYRPMCMHVCKIKTHVKCAGETYQGNVSLKQLVKDGVICTREGFVIPKKIGSIPSLDDVALAFPFLPMMWILEHKAQDRHTLVDGVPGIETSLPLELQYIHAAALPLYPKTRVAHINFTMKVLMIRESRKLNILVYKNLMSLSYHHAQRVFDLVPKLKAIEEKMGEFNDDEKEAELMRKQNSGENHY
ncbi:hypothetical protein MBANPS3_005570 [Mucor bainieri]